MVTPYVLKELLFLCAGIGSVLSISHYTSLSIRISNGKEKTVLEHLYYKEQPLIDVDLILSAVSLRLKMAFNILHQ